MALQRAAAWARHFSARLIVVTVVEPLLVNAAAAAYDTDLVRSEVLPELRDFVDRASLAGRTAIPPFEAMVLVGEPAAEIVALARREHAQLIVIATHGLSGYRRLLLGSTTEKVLRQTAVPVLLTPPTELTARARGCEWQSRMSASRPKLPSPVHRHAGCQWGHGSGGSRHAF